MIIDVVPEVHPKVSKAIQAAASVCSWVAHNTEDLKIPDDRRSLVAASIFQHSLDVGDAILLLFSSNFAGPAYALIRAHFDSYVSGLWLLLHASDASLDNYCQGRPPTIKTMIKEIGASPGGEASWVKATSELNLKSFHGVAHATVEHSFRRFAEDGTVEASYPLGEVLNLLRHTNEVQASVGMRFLVMAGKEARLLELTELLNRYRVSVA